MDNSRHLPLPFQEIEKLFLRCSVCGNDVVYDKTCLAHLLPCLHTVCRSCLLENLQDTPKSLQCAVCQEVHDVSSDDPIASFPVDNTRLDLWEFVQLKKSETGAGPICSVCDGVKAATRCVECAEFLCTGCTSAHERTSKTKHHEIKDLSDLQSTGDLKAFRTPLTCPLHGEAFAVYCSKWTCEKPVCPMCTFTTCKASEGHHIISLKEATAQLKLDLEVQIRSTKDTEQEVRKVGTLVEREVENVDQHEKELEKDIDSAIDEMIEMLKEKRVELKNDMKKKIEMKRGILKKQKGVLEKRESSINDAVQFAEHALCCTNDAAFSQLDKHLAKRLERLQLDPFERKPHEYALVSFNKSHAKAHLLTNLKENLCVSSLSIFPPFTTVESCDEHAENHLTTISVFLRDYMRRPTEGNLSDKIRIKVADPLGRRTVLHLTDHSHAGPLIYSYVPFSPGNHVTYVEAMGTDISHKMFEVTAENLIQRNRDGLSFAFDDQIAHSDVTVRDEGTTFENFRTKSTEKQPPKNRCVHFKGTRGTKPFKKGDVVSYEIDVRVWVKKPLGARELVFEIGLALEQSIDNRHHVEGQPNCWSMIGSHHQECDGICLIIAHEGQTIFHEKMANNRTNSVFLKSFGFVVNMRKGFWEISDHNRKLCSLDIRTENPLFPVISGYNPASVMLKAELKSSTSVI